jgi:hypothetical protein
MCSGRLLNAPLVGLRIDVEAESRGDHHLFGGGTFGQMQFIVDRTIGPRSRPHRTVGGTARLCTTSVSTMTPGPVGSRSRTDADESVRNPNGSRRKGKSAS